MELAFVLNNAELGDQSHGGGLLAEQLATMVFDERADVRIGYDVDLLKLLGVHC